MKLNYKITRNVCYRCFSTWLYASMICSWQRCVKKGRMTSTLFQYVSNKMQRYTVYLYLEISVRVSGGISTHRQEHTQLYLMHPLFVKPLLLEELELLCISNSSTIAAGSSNGLPSTRCCRYSCVCSWWWVKIPLETCRAVSRDK